jgi:hypothetical protein
MAKKKGKTFWRSSGAMIAAFIAGFIYINYFLSSRNIDHLPPFQAWYPAGVMAFVTFLATILMQRTRWLLVFPSLLGVFIGVAFDALTDTKIDRNLFPIEMVMWTVLSVPGIIIGIVIAGQVIRKVKNGRPR